MTDLSVIPELKQIVGALLFAAREPVAIETIGKTLRDAAKQFEGPVQDFAKVTDKDILAALRELDVDLAKARAGIHVGEVANGYRIQNDLNCGIWIRQMLEKGRSNRLSKPALETLAIIAYRQPCTRADIETVRGVSVDAILKNLLEMQLVKATGRSDLPGRPWLFATTQKFLEYFGLKNVQDLPGIDELRRLEIAQAESRRSEAADTTTSDSSPESPHPSELAGNKESPQPDPDENSLDNDGEVYDDDDEDEDEEYDADDEEDDEDDEWDGLDEDEDGVKS